MKHLFFFFLLVTAQVFAAPPTPVPPQASFTVTQCGKIVVIWVLLPNGKVARMDKNRHPRTEEQLIDFMTWLETGPRDIYDAPCGITT